MTFVYFVVALGILVFVHEFGHFIMAKKQGIGVEKFSLGFGPKLFGFTRGETTYLISALPFGGYVKLMGEESDGDAASDVPAHKSYSKRPIRQKLRVVFAGPAMNLLLSLLIMPLVFLLGRTEPAFLSERPVLVGVQKDSVAAVAGLQKGDEILQLQKEPVESWKDILNYVFLHPEEEVTLSVRRGNETFNKTLRIEKSLETYGGHLGFEPLLFIGNDPIVDEVAPNSPAARAGFQKGDEVIRVSDTPVATWTEMSEKVEENGGKPLAVVVKRQKSHVALTVTPQYDDQMKRWLLGVRKDTSHEGLLIQKKYGLVDSLKEGWEENIKLTRLTFAVLGRLVTFQLSYKTLGGPIRIAQASAMAARSGLSDFLYFLAFLSLQLGLLNLLPLPVLDGGHIFFLLVEKVKGSPVSQRFRQTADQIGFFLLLLLMVLVTLNDVQSVWGLGDILEKLKSLFS